MSNPSASGALWSPRLLSVMRIVIALLFLQHGSQKLFGFPGAGQPHHSLALFSFPGVAGVLEFFGGLLVLVGLFTRPTAFILSGEMAVAYFMVHARGGLSPVVNHGELAVLYCFVFLYLAAAGGGAWSADQCLRGGGSGMPSPKTPGTNQSRAS